ncbi:MAG: peptidylprolyl isomerase [Gammaproteobacteria bacterium]|nr:peptidylprolyl isomerase [Gammaproteobacteria bacterium]
MRRILREPLLHFMLAGAVLFLAFEWGSDDRPAPADEIRVDQATLVQFLANRDPRLNADSAATVLGGMSGERRGALIEDYVREEVLFRQARKIGLDPYDHVGRRRLIAQLDYINRGFIEDTLEFSDDELRAFHEANRGRYVIAPEITFTHVYFSTEHRGDNAGTLATDTLEELNRDAVPFHDGPSRGDLFLYHRNYVAREPEEVDSHFGAGFTDAVFNLAPADRWVGPIASEHGHHLVMVSSRKPGRSPPMTEVRQRLAQDLTVERIREGLETFYQDARSAYEIVVDLPGTMP